MPEPSPQATLERLPYVEQPAWTDLWRDCAAVLDRYPRMPALVDFPHQAARRVRITPDVAAAGDVHYYLD